MTPASIEHLHTLWITCVPNAVSTYTKIGENDIEVGTQSSVLINQMSLFQECPVREVPLYLIINPLASVAPLFALLEMSCKSREDHRSCLKGKILLTRFTHPNDRGIIEVTREQLDVDSGGHEHKLEVSPPQQKALQHTQEKVSMNVPLMNLVNNENVVP